MTEGGAGGKSPPSGIFIYGSCVTRDTLEHATPEEFTLVQYVARQSLISAFSGSPAELDLSALGSPFQRRMLTGDATGNLANLLREVRPHVDLLLWDLADERLGVLVSPEGQVITRTVEAISAGLPEVSAWRLVEFGSDEHFDRWSAALEPFVRLLEELDLLGATTTLAVPWATSSDDGGAVPASFGLHSAAANRAYSRYYAAAHAASLSVAVLPPAAVQAASNHRWGRAPFHYTETTYSAVLDLVRQSRDRGSEAWKKAGH